ncbi:hypothetical protein OC842_008012, partial [Tilletia horrida]
MDTASDSEGEIIAIMSDGDTKDGEYESDFGVSFPGQVVGHQGHQQLKPTLDFTIISDNTDALLKIGEHAKDDAYLATTKQAHDLLCRQQPREWAKRAFLARHNAPELHHYMATSSTQSNGIVY